MGSTTSEHSSPNRTVSIEDVTKKVRLGLYPEALHLLEHLLEESVTDPSLHTLKGRVYESMGLFTEAEGAYWNALSIDHQTTFEPFLFLGLLKDRMGDREKGLWVLQEGLKHFPDNPDLLREAGILHGLSGEWDMALPYVLSAYRKHPSHEDNLMALGPIIDRLDLVDMFGEMNQAFKALLDRNPSNQDIQDWHGRFLERMEKSQQALKFFRGLLRKNPKDPRLLGHVARLARNVNEPARALDTYQLLMEETGESPEIYLDMAETHKMNGKPLSALPLVRRALSIDPDNRDALILLGLITIDQGDLDKAAEAVEVLSYAPAHYQLGDLYLRKKKYVQAIGAFARGFSIRPDPYYGLELLKLLNKGNDHFLFLETLSWMKILFPKTTIPGSLLKQELARLPKNPDKSSLHDPETLAIHGLANALLPGQDRSTGYRLLEQAVTVDPLSEVLFWVLSMIDEDNRRWTEAVGWYEKIKKNSREPVTLLHRISENMHNENMNCNLDPLLEEFVATYGPKPGFYRVLASVVARTGDVEKTRSFLKRGMKLFPDDSSLFEDFRSLDPEYWGELLLS